MREFNDKSSSYKQAAAEWNVFASIFHRQQQKAELIGSRTCHVSRKTKKETPKINKSIENPFQTPRSAYILSIHQLLINLQLFMVPKTF